MSARPGLLPREHGAWAQVGVPLLSGWTVGGVTPAGAALTVAAVALFLAHEPLLVLTGERGSRVERELAGPARKRLGVLLGVAALAGSGLVALAPGALRGALAAEAVLGVGVAAAAARGQGKTLPAELGVVAMAAGAAALLAALGGAPSAVALRVALVWAAFFGLSTLAVRAVTARAHRAPSAPAQRALALAALGGGAATLAWAGNTGALSPPWAATLALGAVPSAAVALLMPAPRWLPRLGWVLAGTSLVLVGLVAWLARGGG